MYNEQSNYVNIITEFDENMCDCNLNSNKIKMISLKIRNFN